LISRTDIINITLKIRKNLGYSYSNIPNILKIEVDEVKRRMYILCGDRPDRSILMGPGGRVLYQLTKELNLEVIVVRTLTDMMIKIERIKQAINKAEEILGRRVPSDVKRVLEERIIPLAHKEIENPLRRILPNMDEINIKVAVAFSGGVDSATSLIYTKKLGLKPIAITVKAGPYIIPPHIESRIKEFTIRNNIKSEIIKPKADFHEIIEKAIMGHRVPCGECHKITERTIYDKMKEEEIKIVIFGDLLPTGCHSLHYDEENEILRINLPALLALNKMDTMIIAKQHGHPGIDYKYGCPLVRLTFKRHKHLKMAAIQRILRETRAGILEPNQALKYIKGILRL